MTHWILEGKEAVPVHDVLEWARFFETCDRRVARTETANGEVATVFIGIDHSFGSGPPLLFETMVFGGTHEGEYERCTTWEEAEAQHAAMVALCGREPL
jgi:hypothetical protein